jgi:hypothetical protein
LGAAPRFPRTQVIVELNWKPDNESSEPERWEVMTLITIVVAELTTAIMMTIAILLSQRRVRLIFILRQSDQARWRLCSHHVFGCEVQRGEWAFSLFFSI